MHPRTLKLEIERGLLGSILLAPHNLYDVADVITPQMFLSDDNRKIYEAMLQTHAEGETFDTLLLAKKSKVRGSYIAELLDNTVTASNLKKYVDELQSSHVDTMLQISAENIKELAENTHYSASEKIEKSERLLLDATALTDNRKYHTMKDILLGVEGRLSKTGPEKMGVTTGFRGIDNLLLGLQKSDLIILAARPSVGKTTLALDIARHAARSGVPVGIFSLEMSEDQLGAKMLAGEAMIGAWKIRKSSITSNEDKQKVQKAIEDLGNYPIFVDDNASSTMANIKSSARRMKKQEKIGLIIVDYLQLITPTDSKASTVAQITEISRSLKILAKELDIPVLALSQLNRAVDTRGGTPRLSDLRDSGSIEQDADIVMFIHREDRIGDRATKEATGIADILIEKHRNGPVGRISLNWNEENTTFQDAEFGGNWE